MTLTDMLIKQKENHQKLVALLTENLGKKRIEVGKGSSMDEGRQRIASENRSPPRARIEADSKKLQKEPLE